LIEGEKEHPLKPTINVETPSAAMIFGIGARSLRSRHCLKLTDGYLSGVVSGGSQF
jgi:hypothetical protein